MHADAGPEPPLPRAAAGLLRRASRRAPYRSRMLHLRQWSRRTCGAARFPCFTSDAVHVRARHRARFCSLTGELSFGCENVRNGPTRKAPGAKAIFAPSGSNGCFEIGWTGSSAVRLVTSTQAAGTAPRLDACASVSLASGRTHPIESREVSGLQVVGPVPLSQPDVFAHRVPERPVVRPVHYDG